MVSVLRLLCLALEACSSTIIARFIIAEYYSRGCKLIFLDDHVPRRNRQSLKRKGRTSICV
ncbi:hypothetical protein BT63DRAFT_313418 [Microthyrium microscopicum]|uniref:Secreted protein n=1 Tax=Microthyrium microscopicum TaxID=703497 RepID=A0A6A6U3C3_9PEZI|nr:hypothetical protein BT63DRAFT_313418 [Microthyrium microscopicum]